LDRRRKYTQHVEKERSGKQREKKVQFGRVASSVISANSVGGKKLPLPKGSKRARYGKQGRAFSARESEEKACP